MRSKYRRDTFRRDGYIVERGLISPAECSHLTNVLGDVGSTDARGVQPMRMIGADGMVKMVKVNQIASEIDEFGALAHATLLVDIVEELIGPGSRLFRDVAVVKPGPTSGVLNLHQDSAYWDVEPHCLVSVWIALTDSRPESGSLSVLPGSHEQMRRHDLVIGGRFGLPRPLTRLLRSMVSLAGTGDNPSTVSSGDRFSALKRLVLANESRIAPILACLQDYHVRGVNERDCTVIDARAGDVVFFHSLLVHGTGPNSTSDDRTVYISSYAPHGASLRGASIDSLPLARRST